MSNFYKVSELSELGDSLGIVQKELRGVVLFDQAEVTLTVAGTNIRLLFDGSNWWLKFE